MAIHQALALNAGDYTYIPVIYMVYGDTGRFLDMTINDYTIPASSTAEVKIHRPNNTFYAITATISGQTVTCECDQMLTEVGITNCTLSILSSGEVVSSFPFRTIVLPDNYGDPSVTEQGISLEQMVQDISDLQDKFPVDTPDIADGAVTTPKLADASVTVPKLSDTVLDTFLVTDEVQNQAIASVPDGAKDIPVKDLTCAIDPVQDLHGYANPWPAGGGANILPNTYTTASSNSVTFTVESDGTIKTSGTATGGDADFYLIVAADLNNLLESGNTYYFSGCPSGGSTSTYFCRLNVTGDADTGSGFTRAFAGSTIGNFTIRIKQGTNANGLVFKPQIVKSSVAVSWSPYSNICPISGWTGMNVTRTGSNVWDEETVAVGTLMWTKNYIPVAENTAYYLGYYGTNSSITMFYVQFFDANKTALSGYENPVAKAINTAVTTPVGASYMKFRMQSYYGTTYHNDIAINYPATVTSYHSGTANTVYPISWQTEAGTVYGGELDVTSGELKVTKESKNLGSLEWSTVSGYANPFFRADMPANAKKRTAYTDAQIAITSIYPVYTDPDGQYVNNISDKTFLTAGYGLSSVNRIYIRDDSYSDAATFKTAMNGQQLVYELATPQTYQLTPTEVKTLLGNNNVWCDTGEVLSMKYRCDTRLYIDKRLA